MMNIKKTEFGITKDGEKASRYLMENASGMEVELSDFGAQFLAIRVPDKAGVKRDVLLGYDTLEEYYDNSCGFGAFIGRNGNRIANACVTIEGVEYQLEANNHGNNLHSGNDRSHYKFYQAVTGASAEGSFVELYRISPHLEQGFPGNLKQKIRYTLTEQNEIIIDYEMDSD
ncbi:MAG: galactose-1-epimerase, partial [Lachnospiraceae bacterium]|nr:galactose-1-epimerase [Lachnospiraceae bacterium]